MVMHGRIPPNDWGEQSLKKRCQRKNPGTNGVFFGDMFCESIGDGLFNVFDWKFSFSCFSKIESPGKPVAVNFHPLETPKKTSHFHSCLKTMVRIPRFPISQAPIFVFWRVFFRLPTTVFFRLRPTSLKDLQLLQQRLEVRHETKIRPCRYSFPLEKGKNTSYNISHFFCRVSMWVFW